VNLSGLSGILNSGLKRSPETAGDVLTDGGAKQVQVLADHGDVATKAHS